MPTTGILRRVGGALRDGWLILGVSLLMLLVLEGLYRAQGAVRRNLAGNEASLATLHPYADSLWFDDYLTEWKGTFAMRWKPYVYFRRAPFSGRYINVDEFGHRRTVAVAVPPAPDTLRVFFFGGSTTWGDFQRDHATIPSLATRGLYESGLHHVEVTNFGESGYIFSQEVLELILQLRSGARPDAVVFYDGINDVAAMVQNGASGIPQNEVRRREEFQMGRAVFSGESGVGTDLRAAATLVAMGSRRLQILQRMWAMFPGETFPSVDPDSAAAELVDTYLATVRLVESLSEEYGFRALYVWQPNLFSPGKPMAPFEERLLAQASQDSYYARVGELHARVAADLASKMVTAAPGRFVDMSTIFAGDTSPVFVDIIGHTTEAANVPIVEAVLTRLVPLLRSEHDQIVARKSSGAGAAGIRRAARLQGPGDLVGSAVPEHPRGREERGRDVRQGDPGGHSSSGTRPPLSTGSYCDRSPTNLS